MVVDAGGGVPWSEVSDVHRDLERTRVRRSRRAGPGRAMTEDGGVGSGSVVGVRSLFQMHERYTVRKVPKN